MTRYWTCRTCRERLPRIKRKCKCGAPRPASRRPKHAEALKLPYEHYVELNGGSEACGICGAVQKEGGKRLHRDHDHKTGKPRGVLCFRDNSALRGYMTVEWLESALAYLKRSEEQA
jgi:hypothetical protein